MLMRRRTFLQKTMAATTFFFASKAVSLNPLDTLSPVLLTILHTNDLHGCSGYNADGLKRMVEDAKVRNKNVLLFDTGDFMPENEDSILPVSMVKWMQEMGYSAITLGKQEMKWPFSVLSQQFDSANIPIVLSNRGSFTPESESVLKAFEVIEVGPLKAGVIGIGAEIGENQVQWTEIVEIANETTRRLKEDFGCGLIICLSRLGFCYPGERPSDLELARVSQHIDLILGGGSHTFMEAPMQYQNAEGRKVWISHAGFGGNLLGKLDLRVSRGGYVELVQSSYLPVILPGAPII